MSRPRGTGGGGAVYNYDNSSPTFTDCAFHCNTADVGVAGGGAMRNSTDCAPILINCALVGNSAVYGGGLMNIGSTPSLVNCVFTANTAPNGAALAADSSGSADPSLVTLVNCILWDELPEIATWTGSTFAITYSNVYGGWAGEGNIGDDLVNTSQPSCAIRTTAATAGAWGDNDFFGDLRLRAESPCVDAGDNAVVTVASDLSGLPRIVDGDADGSATVDMGAHEYRNEPAVPAVSEWGVFAMLLMVLTAGTMVIHRKRIGRV